MAKKKKTDDAAAGGETKKSKKKLIILVTLVAVVGGGAAKTFLLKPKPVPPPPAGSVAAMGPVVTEGQLTINLAGGHYLQLAPAIQLVKGAKIADVGAAGPQISDLVISTFSGQDMAALGSPQGLAPVKAKLVAGLNTLFPKTVTGVYFTQFVMQ